MKKFTFVLMMMLAYAGFTVAQTIEDFESMKLTLFAQGTTGTLSIVPNPDPTGINTSVNVGKMVRAVSGDLWQGWFALMPTFDPTLNKYVHVKYWKPRTSPIVLKFEIIDGVGSASVDVHPMTDQTKVSQWEEFVFDMSAYTAPQIKVTFMPDFAATTSDIDIFFDDMYINNNSAPGSEPVIMIENFETIPLSPMEFGTTGSLTLVPNPYKTGVNTSSYVEKFVRPGVTNSGQPWSGFSSVLPGSIDVTVNKFVHIKVWKSRISPIKFKLQGGTGGDSEIFSKYPQTKTDQWEDIVFDFTAKTGTYPIVAFMPDFEDPLVQATDLTMYFDDIVINNESKQSVSVTFNVDMHGSKLTTDQKVYIAGNITGWAIPDTKPEYEMLDADKDSIYTISMVVTTGDLAFKFFKGGSGWSGGEWAGDPNRTLTVTKDEVVNCLWGQIGFVGKRENALAGKIKMYPNPVRDELTINSTEDVSRVIITNTLGKIVGNINYSNNQTINTSDLSRGMYFVTFINRDGTKTSQKLIKN